MNKQELVTAVATAHEITKKQAQAIIETVVDTIVAQLVAGESVNVTGLGVFSTAETAARTGRNPATGDTIEIPASKRPTFKYTAPVKKAVKASAV